MKISCVFAWKKWSRNAGKMKYFNPDRNDRSEHEIWVATIPNHINNKEMATRLTDPIFPNIILSPHAQTF